MRAPRVMHGKTSEIAHDGQGVFAGLPSPFTATRYHSLVVDRDSVPDVLEVTAETEDGLVMGLRHRELPVEGVQFHPESILTESGHALLRNFLATTRDYGQCRRRSRVPDDGEAVGRRATRARRRRARSRRRRRAPASAASTRPRRWRNEPS